MGAEISDSSAEASGEASGPVWGLDQNPGPNEVYRCCHTRNPGMRQHTQEGPTKRALTTPGKETKSFLNDDTTTTDNDYKKDWKYSTQGIHRRVGKVMGTSHGR